MSWLLFTAITLIAFSYFVVMFPMIWPYYFVNEHNFAHYAFLPLVTAIFLILIHSLYKYHQYPNT